MLGPAPETRVPTAIRRWIGSGWSAGSRPDAGSRRAGRPPPGRRPRGPPPGRHRAARGVLALRAAGRRRREGGLRARRLGGGGPGWISSDQAGRSRWSWGPGAIRARLRGALHQVLLNRPPGIGRDGEEASRAAMAEGQGIEAASRAASDRTEAEPGIPGSAKMERTGREPATKGSPDRRESATSVILLLAWPRVGRGAFEGCRVYLIRQPLAMAPRHRGDHRALEPPPGNQIQGRGGASKGPRALALRRRVL